MRRFRFVGLLSSLLLISACSTADPHPIARGAPCAPAGTIAYSDNGQASLNENAAKNPNGAGGKAAWAVAGIDDPIDAKGVRNANCDHVGALARAADGSILHCVWDNPDLMPNAGAAHGAIITKRLRALAGTLTAFALHLPVANRSQAQVWQQITFSSQAPVSSLHERRSRPAITPS